MHSGYAPLSVRLAQYLERQSGWRGLEEVLKHLPGPMFEEKQYVPATLLKKRMKSIYLNPKPPDPLCLCLCLCPPRSTQLGGSSTLFHNDQRFGDRSQQLWPYARPSVVPRQRATLIPFPPFLSSHQQRFV